MSTAPERTLKPTALPDNLHAPQFIELTVSGPTHLLNQLKGRNNYVLEKT
jgi:hypothetical protein